MGPGGQIADAAKLNQGGGGGGAPVEMVNVGDEFGGQPLGG